MLGPAGPHPSVADYSPPAAQPGDPAMPPSLSCPEHKLYTYEMGFLIVAFSKVSYICLYLLQVQKVQFSKIKRKNGEPVY